MDIPSSQRAAFPAPEAPPPLAPPSPLGWGPGRAAAVRLLGVLRGPSCLAGLGPRRFRAVRHAPPCLLAQARPGREGPRQQDGPKTAAHPSTQARRHPAPGDRARTATTTPGTHRKREGGAEVQGRRGLGGRGKRRVRGWWAGWWGSGGLIESLRKAKPFNAKECKDPNGRARRRHQLGKPRH